MCNFKKVYVVLIIFLCTVNVCVSQENVTDFCIVCRCISNTEANCSAKQITNLDDVGFWNELQKYQQMQEINLSYNNLKVLPSVLKSSLIYLNVSHCDLEQILDASLSNVTKLKILDLSYNKLASNDFSRRMFMDPFNPVLKPLLDLTYLDLSYNDIHSLNQDFFNFVPNLNALYLNGNPLAVIDQVSMAAITSLTKLINLGLSSCDLETLPEGLLRRHRRLEYLDISGNKFTSTPIVLAEASNLMALDLSRNPIEIIKENNLSNLKNIQELYLTSMNKLTSIEAGSLSGLENLKVLVISSNPRLRNLSPHALMWTDDNDLEKWPELNELQLNNNNLTEIDSHLLNRWDLLNVIDVSSNPFQCDCTNKWTVTVLVPLIGRIQINDTVNMVCHKPPERRGLTLKQLSDDKIDLNCEESGFLDIPAFDSVIFVGVLIGVFITFPIVLIILLLWKKGVFRRFRNRFHEDYDLNLEFEYSDDFQMNSSKCNDVKTSS